MAESKLIELSYFDPSKEVRLTAYADTIIIDRRGNSNTITALRFGGYPEMVRAMSDAIYGGATLDAERNGQTLRLISQPKGYHRQISLDGTYAVATLMANDDAQMADPQSDIQVDEPEDDATPQPRKCYIFCPEGDRDKLFEELDHKTAAPLKALNDEEFKKDLERVMDWLKSSFAPLQDVEALRMFCRRQDEFGLPDQDRGACGVRIETPHYRYMLRCLPQEDDYNAYLYCYSKETVDRQEVK